MSGQPKNTGFSAKDPDSPSGFSFWESKHWVPTQDAVVVGAGIVGMNAALALRKRHPSWTISIVDRAPIGSASTRNAGFACFGSPSELLDDWKQMGPDATLAMVEMRWKGLLALRDTWGDEAIAYRACGAVEAFTDPDLHAEAKDFLPVLNQQLAPIMGREVFAETTANQSGLRELCGSISSPLEGDVDTSRMIATMRSALAPAGIQWLAGMSIESVEAAPEGWSLATPHGVLNASRVFLATNALASDLVPVDVGPVPNMVLVSQPLPELRLTSTVHHDRGYVYAREVDGRILIGGGRQWDCQDPGESEERLVAWAQRHIQGAEAFATAHRWTGQLGVGSMRLPIVQEVKPGLYVGVRLGGMGVAIGTHIGQSMAGLA